MSKVYFIFALIALALPHTLLAQEELLENLTSQTPKSKSELKSESKQQESSEKNILETSEKEIPGASPTQTLQTKSASKNFTSKPNLSQFKLNTNDIMFKPEKNGFKLSTPQIKYSIDGNDEIDIAISGVSLTDETFKILAGKIKDLTDSKFQLIDNNTEIVYISVPLALGSEGKIEVLSEDGKSLFEKEINDENLELGQSFAKSLKPTYWEKISMSSQAHLLFYLNNAESVLLNPDKRSGFRFCWNKKKSPYFSIFCSPYYRYSKKDRRLVIQTQTTTTKVFINQKESSAQGSINTELNKDYRFLATSSRGYSIEFFSRTPILNLTDYYSEEGRQWVYLIGYDKFPLNTEIKHFPFIDPNSLNAYFSWEPTIGDTNNYWVSLFSKDLNFFTISGDGGGLFLFPFEISKIPTITLKPKLRDPLTSTYSSLPRLRGRKLKTTKIKAIPPSKERVSKNKQEFYWYFNAPEPAAENYSEISLLENENDSTSTYVANYKLYRGYSRAFSLRLAGALASNSKINFLGEVAYTQWLESLFGWRNKILSHQRWGYSVKHFKPLNTDTLFSLQLTTFDVKYRFTPGIFERDETWGLILGVEDVYINRIHGAFSGVGFFWARSMPKVFDTIANWFPFMSYPKWVDMEMIYYLSPMLSDVKLGNSATYSVNFHGKVLWKKNFFGEAGFGLKGYSYITKTEGDSISVNAFYGTAGLGVNF